MQHNDFKERYGEEAHFFLSEFDKIEEKDLACVIELMRAANHIRYMMVLNETIPMEDEDVTEKESIFIMLLSISASQLREALKLFGDFTKTELFKKINKKFSTKEREMFDNLIGVVDNFGNEGNIISDILKPLRDSTFHYCPKKAKEWIKQQKEEESQEKPHYYTVNLDKRVFGPGLWYDDYLYRRFLFFGSHYPDNIMKTQEEVWELQFKFIEAVKIITKHLLIEEEIPSREFGWFNKYSYGFKK